MTTTTTATATELATARIHATVFRNGISNVIFAAADSSLRYALNGIRVEFTRGQVEFIATDGARMAVARIELDHSADGESFTISLSDARKLAKIRSQAFVDVSFHLGRTVFSWTDGKNREQELDAQHLDGRFPKWRDTFNDADNKATGAALAGKASELLPIFEPTCAVSLAINGDAKRVADQAHLGPLPKSIKHSGKLTAVSLNGEFAQQWLESMADSAVELRFNDSNAAAFWRTANGRYFYVLMPMADNRWRRTRK